MKKCHRILEFIWNLAWLKTIYFNLKYFPFKLAILCPVFIYKHTDLYLTKGTIIISCPIRTGMFKIGVPETYSLDMKHNRTKWKVEGTVRICGAVTFGRGCCIRLIGKESILNLGSNVLFTGGSDIICNKNITIGDNSLVSWDVLIMDTDFHHIMDADKNIINPPAPIVIGKNTWIGCRCTILKGTTIAENNVIAANSTVTRNIKEAGAIIGGQGTNLRIIKENIFWEL